MRARRPLCPCPGAVGRSDPERERERSCLVADPGCDRLLWVDRFLRSRNRVSCRSSLRAVDRRPPGRSRSPAGGQASVQNALCHSGRIPGLGLRPGPEIDRSRRSGRKEANPDRERCLVARSMAAPLARDPFPARSRRGVASLRSRIGDLDDWYARASVPTPSLHGTFRARDAVEGFVVRRHEDLNAAVV
jgi:hypothetical protein